MLRIFFIPVIVGVLSAYIAHVLIKHEENTSITVSDIERVVPFQIGIGKFWFDEDKVVYANLASFLRTDGIQLTELSSVPDRKIAEALRYVTKKDARYHDTVPLPNSISCRPALDEPIEARELKIWRELVESLSVEVLLIGEVTSNPRELRLWIGGFKGLSSLVLPFSTSPEIMRASDRTKIAILMTIMQVAEDRLHLERDYDAHVPKVRRALESIEHTLTWRGLDDASRLAIKVTRARLHENLLIHSHNIPTRAVEESYWALRHSNEVSDSCGSMSMPYHFSEANMAWILTRRTKSAVWDERAVGKLTAIHERAMQDGQIEFAETSEMIINRLEVERGIRNRSPDMIQEGLQKLENQYSKLLQIPSPFLWMKLPDAMIALYRQAAKATGNVDYESRSQELVKCLPNLGGEAYELPVSSLPASDSGSVCPAHLGTNQGG